MQNQGKVDIDEMYRVFNMGIGYVVIIPKRDLDKAKKVLNAIHQKYYEIGVIRKGTGVVTFKD
jgi:phosphoribosylformylglycinamidine cyclo-ligase